jgi:PASTA domain
MKPFDGNPVVAPSGDGRLELFAFGRQDGRLWHAWQAQWSNSSDWYGWCDMGLPGSFPATVGANGDGTLVLAAGNEFSQLSYASQTAWSNGWSGWTALPSVPGGGDDAAGVAANADGRLQLFLVGTTGGHLYRTGQMSWSNGWSGWQDHGAPDGAELSGPVTAACSGDGRIEVFAIDTHGSMWNVRQTAPSSAYSGWNAYGNPGVALTDRPALARSADGRLELFVLGQDGRLYHQWETAVGTFSWSGWNSFDATTAPDFGFTFGPVVAPSADGRLELFLTAGDRNVYHAWQTSASNGWSDWVNEGAAGGGFGIGAPGLARNGDGRLEIFAVAFDRNIYHKWQTAASNGWGPWTLLDPQAPPPLTTTVPDLIGLSVALAQERVQAAQLHLTAHGSGNWVGSQSPAGGTMVPVGSSVSVGLVANPP